MKSIKKVILTILVSLIFFSTYAQVSGGFEFIQQDITEIIYAVSLSNSTPIVCDDTVTGRASFRFAGKDFNAAFESFLSSNRLYVNKKTDVWTVSRIKIEINPDSPDCYSIDAYDVKPERLFEGISETTGVPIIHEALPSLTTSIHVKNTTPAEAVSLIMKSWFEYEVIEESSFILVRRKQTVQPSAILSTVNAGHCSIVKNESEDDFVTFDTDLEKCTLGEVLEKLSMLTGMDFCNLSNPATSIERLSCKNRTLTETLTLITSQAGAAYTVADGVYVFYTSQDSVVGLTNAEKHWHTINLSYLTANDAISLLMSRFKTLSTVTVNNSMFLVETDAGTYSEITEFIQLCDIPKERHVVHLQYIKPETFLSHLPPGVSASQFSDTGSGTTLFFTGSNEAYTNLLEVLPEIDLPATRISYDLLILQVQDTSTDKWTIRSGASTALPTDVTNLSTVLGSVLALNFDVVGTFGITFANQLQASITNSTAEVYADTTLHGVSGSSIQFENTNTYRYRDPYVDSTTGETKNTGVTREIVSGLFLDIEGWVSGDGMVTTTVKATVSRQGADVSSNSGNPPPTYQKQITTQVRGMAGEPVILSGLKQTETNDTEQGVPWISKIPLIGWLFKGKDKSKENTEMIIYLVPHIDGEETANAEEGE